MEFRRVLFRSYLRLAETSAGCSSSRQSAITPTTHWSGMRSGASRTTTSCSGSRSAAASDQPLVLDKRLLMVSGKGGVGKSAVAAGLALLAQRRGQRVLAMEMGSPGGLSAHFGTSSLEFEPREVRPGLHAMRVVRSDALLEYLGIH